MAEPPPATASGASLRFCSLGSGSGGNATLIEARAAGAARPSRVLVDCGFTLRELTTRLAGVGLAPVDLDALFITHEHGDHVGCALSLARRHGVPLWTSRGTWRAIGAPEAARQQVRFARDGDRIAVGDLLLHPFTVPHDAAEPLQLQFICGALRLAVLTDAGSVTEHLVDHLRHCDALVLECNHDRSLLAASAYPASLKARIAAPHGHLSNDSAAEILSRCLHDGLRHVVAAHLSEQNNQPGLARAALAAICAGHALQLHVAAQADGFDWIQLKEGCVAGE